MKEKPDTRLSVRKANELDIARIATFVCENSSQDFYVARAEATWWVTGENPNGTRKTPHDVWLALDEKKAVVVGIAVLSNDGTLESLLVHRRPTNRGIEGALLERAKPGRIRPQMDRKQQQLGLWINQKGGNEDGE